MAQEPLHPILGEPKLIPWLGFEDQRLLSRVHEAGVRTTAKALVQDVKNPQVALFARETFALGLELAPENWRNQLPHGHRLRPASFDALPYALKRPYTPDQDSFEPEAIMSYSSETIEAQVERHATLMVAAAHVAGPPGTIGRETDLRLIEASARYVATEGLREPSATDMHQTLRVLFVPILVKVADLDEGTIAALVDQYSGLDAIVDGYIVHAVGGCASGPRAAAVAALAAGVEAATGKPVAVQGVGDLYLAYLAAGLSVCTGFAENRTLEFPPREPPKRNEKGTFPRRLPVFHGATLHSFAVRSSGKQAELLSRAFDEHQCGCPAHPKSSPPSGNAATKEHTLEVALEEWASQRNAANPALWLAARCARAGNARRQLKMKPLPQGWHTVVPAAHRARGLGAEEVTSSSS